MTLTTSTNTVTFTGDGVTDDFTFNNRFYDNSHLKVYVDGTLKTITTHYTVTGAGSPSGGTVTFTVGNIPGNGLEVIIQRVVPYTQDTDLENFDGNPADVTERQLDLIVMQTQQLKEITDRAITTPVGGSSISFPSYSADVMLAWSDSVSGTVVNTGFTADDVQGAIDAVDALSSGSGVLISSNDAAVGFLNGKLVAGSNITLTENNDGGNETLTIAAASLNIGALTDVAIATDDKLVIGDTSDSNNTKRGEVSDVISHAQNINALSSATVATGDLLIINDIDDSNNPKKVTAQSVADLRALAAADITGLTEVVVTALDTFLLSDQSDSGNLKRDTVQGILDLVVPLTTFGAVGTYLFAKKALTAGTIAAGATESGANIAPVSIDMSDGSEVVGSAPSGTWRNMGAAATQGADDISLWARTV